MKILLISIVLVALVLVGIVTWVGLYAMPVPENVTEVQGGESKDGLTVELATWEYGEVAQILHIRYPVKKIDPSDIP